MSEFLDDPSVLTKEKLKSALLANNVSLPNGEQKKDVYVQLYLKNLTAQNKKKSAPPEAFSSDEELPAPVVSNRSRSGRKATRKTDKPRPDEVDVLELSDEDLREQLQKYGISVGPIVASTRKLYEKKLQKLLDEGPPEAVAPPVAITETDGNHNGSTEFDHYSDKEEETAAPEPEPEPEPAPVVVERPLRSRGKTPVTTRARSSQHNRDFPDFPLSPVKPHVGEWRTELSEIEKVSTVETPKADARDMLKEMFPNDVNTPTGISATCRRPIRGAAARAGISTDSWLDDSRLRLTETNYSSSSSSYVESRPSTRLLSSPLPASTYSSASTLRQAPASVLTARAPISGVPARRRRWLPVWAQVLVFGVLAGFLFLVYQAMETNESNPFGFLAQQAEEAPAGQTSK
ncbi:thymopoietin a isoform X6 [Alosa sapidissima]|uniref:thymopoietin a isoform X6 n=1 Tax=Alosa sapidissima TaxID=34773 RepID=UPI001C088C50|nr:thymopoietin a isoform X6 [Alosa sapidissima]